MPETGCPAVQLAVALPPSLQPLASQLVLLMFYILLLSPGCVADCPPLTPAGPPGTLSALLLACDALWAFLVPAAAHTRELMPEQCIDQVDA